MSAMKGTGESKEEEVWSKVKIRKRKACEVPPLKRGIGGFEKCLANE